MVSAPKRYSPAVLATERIDVKANLSGEIRRPALPFSVPTGRGIQPLVDLLRAGNSLVEKPELRGNTLRYFNSPLLGLRDLRASTCRQQGMRWDVRTWRLRDPLGTLRQGTLLTGGTMCNSEAGIVLATGSPPGDFD
ncbi:hypothetical protein R1flu_004569 [Riccia fluitans]|uniref:Uncharacterized protein n=1 Tax=Riccia fluitans TaxID=41844 RepID=A0ABD1YR31_9MARC